MSIIKLIVQILFYGLIGLLTVYSMIMIYVLLRFGKSKILALIVGAFYLVIMLSLYSAALINLSNIPFMNL